MVHLALALACLSAAARAEPAALPAAMPWDMAELRKAPKFEWVDQASKVRSLLYEGPAYGEHPTTHVFAYYATPGSLAGDPSLDHDLPAIVLVHGEGGTAVRDWVNLWARRGYAAIAMDLSGNRRVEGTAGADPKGRVRLDDGGPKQGDDARFFAIDKATTEHWCYHAVANVVRAHSLIRTMPGVDAERTAITGISWGGAVTCIAASIDDRFKAAVAVYGCGYLHRNSVWLPQFRRLGDEHAAKWAAMYDPSVYLPMCKTPILFINGAHDFAYPLDSMTKSYDAAAGERHVRVDIDMRHSHFDGWAPREIEAFVASKVGDGRALAKLDAKLVGVDDADGGKRKLTVKFATELDAASVRRVVMYTTRDDGPINARRWTAERLDGGDGDSDKPDKPIKLVGPIPVNAEGEVEMVTDATAWFVAVTDDRDLTVTSPVIVVDPGPAIK